MQYRITFSKEFEAPTPNEAYGKFVEYLMSRFVGDVLRTAEVEIETTLPVIQYNQEYKT